MEKLSNNLSPRGYTCYRVTEGGKDTYYCQSIQLLINIISHAGSPSPNIFDVNADGVVTMGDVINFLGALGTSREIDFNLADIDVLGKFSSGWFCSHPLWSVIFVKVTPYDEQDNSYVPDVLKSFVIEGVRDGVNVKMWFHVN